MSDNTKTLSIRSIISLVFVLALLLSAISIGILIFRNWYASAEETTERVSRQINERIYEKINNFMHVPVDMNEKYYDMIESGMLDLTNDEQRDRFFVGALKVHSDQVYSFSYGTVSGEYYGARRNPDGIIEIMRNDTRTSGNSWYYSVNEDMAADELVVQAGAFDPRTRAWYQAAERSGRSVLSPVYKHFVMDDLTISAARPVFGADGVMQGVLGAHVLLTGIGQYLKDTVHEYEGYALIFEKESGAMIANSLLLDNYEILADGSLHRYIIGEIGSDDMRQAYEHYKMNQNSEFLFKGADEHHYVTVRQYSLPGIDWVVVSAIPQSIFMAPIRQSIYWTALLISIGLVLFMLFYIRLTKIMLKPMNHLLRVSEALSAGNLDKRAEVIRNDEIGVISKGLNNLADKMQYYINNLEDVVSKRTNDLHKANAAVEESKNQLQLILNSTAEAIYGIDLQGNCTFCNVSCIEILGYDSQSDLLGKNMHDQIHHSHRDGTPFSPENCKIMLSIRQGKGYAADDEVFWRADGTTFDVAYHSYPQKKNDRVVGGVISFMDITDRKKKEDEIRYLNCYDPLTGLYNRRCFEENISKIDIEDNLPLSVIFADINGLKMTNDIFGHAAGDELIRKSADILKHCCRERDVIARVGGDEFIILLPNTTEQNAEKILKRIQSGFLDARVEAIKCSIALGLDIKRRPVQSLDEILANAENAMYRDKTINRKSINKDIIDTVVETLHAKSSREKQHSEAVSRMCGEVGTALKLSELEIDQLTRAGYLHDIGKITLDADLLLNEGMSSEDHAEMQQHTIVGYRILNLFDDTLDLAEYVYSHHERWDGNGYPRGLKGKQIPLIARIISVAETFDRVKNKEETREAGKTKAIAVIRDGAGTQFDPKIAQLFVNIMEHKEDHR